MGKEKKKKEYLCLFIDFHEDIKISKKNYSTKNIDKIKRSPNVRKKEKKK